MKALIFSGHRKVDLGDWADNTAPLNPDEIRGPSLATLVSPGTEIGGVFDAPREKPQLSGYAAIFRAEQIGSNITDIKPGQLLFSMGAHCSYQSTYRGHVQHVPEGLTPERALFARLTGVSWSTLITTIARPTDRVVVFGLGPIGNLAAQLFTAAGYTVIAIEPVAWRRELARKCGLSDVRESVDLTSPEWGGGVALTIDCSAHEKAILTACMITRKGGEVVLIGVPWKQRSDVPAFDILKEVFFRYLRLRSGWEWEVPTHPRDFTVGSINGNLISALDWINRGKIIVDPLFRVVKPANAQEVYDNLLVQKEQLLSYVFDWR